LRFYFNTSLLQPIAISVPRNESASKFSRDYSRQFGAPHERDIRRMRLDQTSSNEYHQPGELQLLRGSIRSAEHSLTHAHV